MAPVAAALRTRCESGNMELRICVTAQHRQMLDQVLTLFQIRPDNDLNIMRDGQDLTDVTVRVLTGLRDVFRDHRPDVVLVHGDTSTTLAASLAAYYQRIEIAHVEAGLRTGNIYSPWPEEINRRLTGSIAGVHFAPTEIARRNLLNEGIDQRTIHVTGNTVVDALLEVVTRLRNEPELRRRADASLPPLDPHRRLLLVTGHRRENFGSGIEEICLSLRTLAQRRDLQIVYPVHLNPNVELPVRRILSGISNVHLIGPLDYLPFVRLMDRSHIILTDSGGIQEEAPSLGKPVLVMRDATERPEAVGAGTVKLVGTNKAIIISETQTLLDDQIAYDRMATAINPFGDGRAAHRIADIIAR